MSRKQYQVSGIYEATYPSGNKKRGQYQNENVTAEFPQYAMQIVAEEAMTKHGYIDFKWVQVWAAQIEDS